MMPWKSIHDHKKRQPGNKERWVLNNSTVSCNISQHIAYANFTEEGAYSPGIKWNQLFTRT